MDGSHTVQRQYEFRGRQAWPRTNDDRGVIWGY